MSQLTILLVVIAYFIIMYSNRYVCIDYEKHIKIMEFGSIIMLVSLLFMFIMDYLEEYI